MAFLELTIVSHSPFRHHICIFKRIYKFLQMVCCYSTYSASEVRPDHYAEGAGACVQILLFSVAAIELKRKAPAAHTFLECKHRVI